MFHCFPFCISAFGTRICFIHSKKQMTFKNQEVILTPCKKKNSLKPVALLFLQLNNHSYDLQSCSFVQGKNSSILQNGRRNFFPSRQWFQNSVFIKITKRHVKTARHIPMVLKGLCQGPIFLFLTSSLSGDANNAVQRTIL